MASNDVVDFIKDPDEVLDYKFDWYDWLNPLADTISTSTFFATSGISVGVTSNTTTNSTVWLSGGTSGQPYRITNRIVTAGGRTSDRSITIRVQER